MLACEVAAALLAPFIVDRLARLAWRAPLASRLALRDLARYRSRSGAALAAVSFAVFIATIAILIASIRYDDALDYIAPNMAANQLVIYNPGNDPTQYQPGQFTPAAKLAATRRQAEATAAQLHAPAPLELDLAVSPNVAQQGLPTQNVYGTILSLHNRMQGGLPWVATPALLKAFGISQGEVKPGADVLTVRALLPSTGGLILVSGSYLAQSPNTPCPAGMCIQDPVIQEVSKLPSGTSVPNTVITEAAVRALHETVVPYAWLIQAPSAITPAQVNAARQAAVGLGTTIQTKSGQLSLGEISDGATIGGLLLALGVLAMTVGLIRGETVGDLRTLAAAGQLAAPDPVGSAHLAAALLTEPDAVAAKAIAAADVTPERLYAAVGAGPAERVEAAGTAELLDVTLGESAKDALKAGLKSALRLGHNYIGTEHLLLGLLSSAGPVTDAFAGLGLSPERAEELIAAELAGFQARKEAN